MEELLESTPRAVLDKVFAARHVESALSGFAEAENASAVLSVLMKYAGVEALGAPQRDGLTPLMYAVEVEDDEERRRCVELL
eukprot:CAMPEP_0114631270 /NCGR_PEP_ID=MMETSP0168-20121206/14322_1 /TAXON_ID=95228 ORGANISM="Vannella sp., Strain DIVA3 517/6/12" /NCGR_SAMPLE_ID=MMETSP0168 /ASSEMBLY_ACC=CAM_ASM_000044 /LENGTH=81 /DNA_ID=CAMNT_0001842823 /DNA_START=1 /DNA_END=243 /DNA_ORIENTATION=+